MADVRTCPRCGAELQGDIPGGHCLRCLLELGFAPVSPEEGEDVAISKGPSLADAAPTSDYPGDRIGRYRLLRTIGQGGFGMVFLAEQHEPVRRRVALKVIRLGMDTKQVIARFEVERQALALMDHPNIAKVLDAGTISAADSQLSSPECQLLLGRPYVVMDYVEGVVITEYCDREALGLSDRLALFTQVCQAVQHAHQKGIIHRDLKPSNILVTEQDGQPVPKLIDFGIAKATLDRGLTPDTLATVIGQFAGTPAYMSPEQAGMAGLDVDTRSDIYSLGVLLYELLTSRPAFDPAELRHAAVEEVLRAVREREPAPPSIRITTLTAEEQATVAEQRQTDPSRLPQLLRGDLDWIVMKALEKDRNRRYETPNGLAMDIQRFLVHEPVLARPPSRLYRLRKLVRRNRVACAAGVLVAAALVAGLGFSLWFYLGERAALERALAAERAARKDARHSEQIALFLKEMLEGVGPSVARGLDTALLRDILDKTSARLDRATPEESEIELDLRRTLASVYTDLGEYDRADRALRRALELQPAPPHGTDPNHSALLNNHANLLVRQGKLEEADRAAREALALRQAAFGQQHTNVAGSLNTLGTVLWSERRLAEAEDCFRRALAIYRSEPAADDADLAVTLGSLGNLLAQQRKPLEAEPLFREALALQRQRLGEDHPVVARSLGNLANALSDQGNRAQAEAILRESVALRRRILNSDHPDLAYSLHNLATVLALRTNLVEAEALFRESLAIRRQRLPEGHPLTAGTLKGLGDTLRREGQLDEAESVLREALAIYRERSSGRDQHATASSLRSLALVFLDRGRPVDAEPLLREALAICQRVLTPDDPDISLVRATLNRALERQAKPPE